MGEVVPREPGDWLSFGFRLVPKSGPQVSVRPYQRPVRTGRSGGSNDTYRK